MIITYRDKKVVGVFAFAPLHLRISLDIGLLDMQLRYLEAEDSGITIIDASSDMLVICYL
jgi:hypothetical protein